MQYALQSFYIQNILAALPMRLPVGQAVITAVDFLRDDFEVFVIAWIAILV